MLKNVHDPSSMRCNSKGLQAIAKNGCMAKKGFKCQYRNLDKLLQWLLITVCLNHSCWCFCCYKTWNIMFCYRILHCYIIKWIVEFLLIVGFPKLFYFPLVNGSCLLKERTNLFYLISSRLNLFLSWSSPYYPQLYNYRLVHCELISAVLISGLQCSRSYTSVMKSARMWNDSHFKV